jgi:signal transduction histidine kinase
MASTPPRLTSDAARARAHALDRAPLDNGGASTATLANISLRLHEQLIRVLVVDDDPAFRRLCAEYLRDDSRSVYETIEAGTAAEAVGICGSEILDCLLIDYNLPDASGTTLLRELRNSCGPLTPMILLTGIGSEEIAIEALHAGAADYIPKDRISEESLARAISNSVERARLMRSIDDRNQRLMRANEELQRKSDQIQRFYQAVSHEIKTPLTAAREFLSLVADGVYGQVSEQQAEALGLAMESCDQIAGHFNELIEVTRLDTGKLRLKKAPCGPQRLVTLSVASVRAAAAVKGVALEECVAADLPPLDVDGSRIVQVLSNLLNNAEKFTPAGGTIKVFAERGPIPDTVTIGVSDTGCGIAPHDLPRIFDRLYQAASHAETFTRGLGLGLSIAHDIVALHGGELLVESEVGRGSTFKVQLPVAVGA